MSSQPITPVPNSTLKALHSQPLQLDGHREGELTGLPVICTALHCTASQWLLSAPDVKSRHAHFSPVLESMN